MSTQYGRLLKTPPSVRDPALRAGLRGQSRAALEKFLQRCNATRSLDEQIPLPPPGAGYPAYAPQLLAHLWAGAGILPALQALAQLAGTPIPAAPSYSDMDGNLLRRLWELAEDGSALHQLLQRRDRFAEMELLRLYNRNRSAGRLEEPAPQDGYLAYPRVLLAVLWALVANADALRALGRQLRLNVPEPFCCDTMPDRLLGQLWRLGRDGTALRTLWHRRGLLPVEKVDARTPEAVLGFLAWHEQRDDARDELLRRYCLLGATPGEFLQRFKRRRAPWPYESVDEFFQDVLVKFLEQVETWDYLSYPALEHRLFRSIRNLIIDRIRREARQPRATDPPVLADAPAEESPDAAPVLAEEVPPLAFRVVLKAKFSVELTAEELDWSAGQNLEQRGLAAPSAEQRLRERQRISAWLQQHPGPTGQQLAECFLWYAPCKFDRALRDWKLRQAADELRQRIERLLPPADAEAARLARQFDEALTALIQRGSGGCRRPQRGTVPSFAALQEAGGRLWHRLGQCPLNHCQADDFAAGRQRYLWFGEQFPLLLKLAACWRLVRWLIAEGPPAAVALLGRLAGWLEAGQWLATFPERDRRRGRAFAQELQDHAARFPSGCRAGLELLLLWLRSAEQTGLPAPALIDLDRAWWLDRAAPLADRLVAHAFRARWVQVGEIASQMRQNPADGRRIIWSAERERDDCLQRLQRAQSAALVKFASCRRLVAYLMGTSPEEAQALARLLEAEQWPALREQVRQRATADSCNGDETRAALRLLCLWLHALAEAGLPGQALEDLDRVWSLSHEPGYPGPANLPAVADDLVTAAWQGNWPAVARGAARALGTCPDGAPSAWTAQQEFRGCLQRLADRREPRR